MPNKNCLNCGKELTDKFCSGCGQKADTHRITLKRFITHDLIHGTFHLDKGMLFTAKQALLQPGKAALDYIAGKRVNYYNVFYFILLLIGFNILLTTYYNTIALSIAPDKVLKPTMNDVGKTLGDILSRFGKLFIFALVPVTALNSFLIFKQKQLNYSEHFIISGILLLGIVLITTLIFLFSFLEFTGLPSRPFNFIHHISPYIILAYIVFGYWNAFRKDYPLLGFLYRILFFMLLCGAEILLFVWIILGIATGWNSGAEIEFMF